MEKLPDFIRKMAGLLKKSLTSLLLLVSLFTAGNIYSQGNLPSSPVGPSLNTPAASPAGETQPAGKSEKKEMNLQRIIPLDSPLYSIMDRLYLLAGKARPSAARPWSADEAEKIFLKIEKSSLASDSMAAGMLKLAAGEIYSGTENTGREKASFRATKNINIEGYYRTNDESGEWEHGYEERLPLLYIPFEGWFFNNLYSTLDLTVKEEYAAIAASDDNYTNIPSKLTDLDWYFPFRAFISLGGEHWNIQAGRDQASWGSGITGNLMLSDYSEFYNLLRLTTYWDRFKFTAVYIGLDPWLTGEEKDFDAAAEDNGLAGGYQNFGELFKAFLGHRVEFRVSDRFTLAVSEAVIFGNKYINFTELNPVFVFHNLFSPEYSNAMMSLEADYTLFSGMGLYMQFLMDEFQVPGYEDEGSRPGATGLLAGFTLARPAGQGIFTFRGEAAMTEPYLYNRWHPLTRFTNRRRIWSTVLDEYEYINKPIGYEHGPDAVVLYGSAEFEKPGKLTAAADLRYTLKGEMNASLDGVDTYDTGEEASRLGILSGTVEKELTSGLHGKFFLNKAVTLASDIYFIHTASYGNEKGRDINNLEMSFSTGFRF